MLGFFYGDIVGLEGASGLRSDQTGRRRVGTGDQFNNAAGPSAGTGEGAEAGDGDPAPGVGAVPHPAASKPGRRPRMKNKASMSLSK